MAAVTALTNISNNKNSSTDASSSKPSSKQRPLSKRQKRKLGPNPSNTWSQQPKIKSEEARNKAYLATAGFTTSTKRQQSKQTKRKQQQQIDPNVDVLNSPECKFGRLLASPDARIRHATILKLEAYLRARCAPLPLSSCKIDESNKETLDGDEKEKKRRRIEKTNSSNNEDTTQTQEEKQQFRGMSKLDLLKLWKGLWHTLYLCDHVTVQEEVSNVLSKLIWSFSGSEEDDEYAGRLYLMAMDEGEEGDDTGEDIVQEVQKEKTKQVTEKEVGEEENEIMKSYDIKISNPTQHDNENDSSSHNEEEDECHIKHCRGAHLSQLFIRTYFQTLSREWSNMDKYRIDKFYTLTRLMIREIYRYMAARHWNLGIIRLFNDALFEDALSAGGGNGIRFHLLDICLEELALVNAEDETGLKLTEATLLDCLEPFFAIVQREQDTIVQVRVMEKVVYRFLMEFSIVSDNYVVKEEGLNHEGGKEEGKTNTAIKSEKKDLVMNDVHVGSVAQFLFELASDPETFDRYRKELYEMHKTYVRKIKEVGRDVCLEEINDEEEEAYFDEEEELGSNSNKEELCNSDGKDTIELVNMEDDISPIRRNKRKRNNASKSKVGNNEHETNERDNNETKMAIESNTKSEYTNDDNHKGTKKKKKKKKKKISVVSGIIQNKDGNEIVDNNDGKMEDNSGKEEAVGYKQDETKEARQKSILSNNKKKKKKKIVNNEACVLPEKDSTDVKKSTDNKDNDIETITISLNEQRKAVEKSNANTAILEDTTRQIEKNINTVPTEMELPCTKKVKFGKPNMSKSYKASLKGLKKIDHKVSLDQTPEKGILLSRNRKPNQEKKEKKKKKKKAKTRKRRN